MQLCIKYSNNAIQTVNVYLFLFLVYIFFYRFFFFVETSFSMLCFLLCLFAANLWQL